MAIRNDDLQLARSLHPTGRSLDATAATSRSQHPHRLWVRLAWVGDALAAAVAAVVAAQVPLDVDASPGVSLVVVGGFVVAAWPALLATTNAYGLRSSLFGVEELRRVLRAGINLLAIVGLAHFMLRVDVSRGYVATAVPAAVLLTVAWRTFLRSSRGRQLRARRGLHKVVAVGPVLEVSNLVARLASRPGSSVQVVAFVADDLSAADDTPAPLDELLRLPSRDAIPRLAEHDVPVDLLVRAGRPGPDEMATLARQARYLGVPVAIAPHQHDTGANMAVSYVPVGATPLLVMETPTLRPAAAALKTVLDKAIALAALVLLAPVLITVAAVIAIRDGRPVFFAQERVGHHGRLFRCLKFRTMCTDAEARLEHLRHHNEADGPLFKLRNDPRVTPTGDWLRAHSVDELPQLWNVLRGDMSIVGPRPPLPHEAATYDERAARRLMVRPGITGLWQVEGRSDLPWDDAVYLDLMYIDHWSPLLDLVIMARTVRTVVRPTGAY